jgi:hypothetical protein
MKRIGLLVLTAALFIGAYAANSKTPVATDAKVNQIDTDKLNLSAKDSITYSKLTSEEIYSLRKMEIEAGQPQRMPISSTAIILICALPFLFAGTIIYINVKSQREESKRKYDFYTKALEMGQPIPEHFFDEPKKANPSSNLKKGILWLVIGLGALISFLVIHEREGVILGIIPGFVGIGYLLVHFLEKPKTESTAE